MLVALKVGKWVSGICVIALAAWLSLILVAVNAEPHKEASVIDRTGRIVVTGKNYLILTHEHWWRDAGGLFGPYLVAILVAALLFWYCRKRLRHLNPAVSQYPR